MFIVAYCALAVFDIRMFNEFNVLNVRTSSPQELNFNTKRGGGSYGPNRNKFLRPLDRGTLDSKPSHRQRALPSAFSENERNHSL